MNFVFTWLSAILDLLKKIFAVVTATKQEVDSILARDTDIDARLTAIKAELDIGLSGTVDAPVAQ